MSHPSGLGTERLPVEGSASMRRHTFNLTSELTCPDINAG